MAAGQSSGAGGIGEFGGGTPSPEILASVSTLPAERTIADGSRLALIVHGSPRSDMEFITGKSHPPPLLRSWLETPGASLLVSGQTHAPMWYRCGQGLLVNPGASVSMPVTRTSRTFALVASGPLTVSFPDGETGKPFEVPTWSEDDA